MKTSILFLSANPQNTMRLRLDKEFREIDEGLHRVKNRDNFSLHQKWAVRPKDIRRAMLEFKPNIVHFSGHGMNAEGIAFEDEMGNATLIGADTLANFFELFADKVECVLLSACYSEGQAQAIAKHINYVIGMKSEIEDNTALEFSVAFYDALGSDESIEFAYKLACNAIQWTNVTRDSIPVLIKRQQNDKDNKPQQRNDSEQKILGKLTHEKFIKDGLSYDVREVPTLPSIPELAVTEAADKYVKAQKQIAIFTEQLALLQRLEKFFQFNYNGDLTSRFSFHQMVDVNAWNMFEIYAKTRFGVTLPANPKFDIPCPGANFHPDTLVYVPDPTGKKGHYEHGNVDELELKWNDYFHFVIYLPELYCVAVNAVEYFLQSTLLPHRFTPLLNHFMEIIDKNTEAIRTTMNECASILPIAYPDAQSLESFDTIWIQNKYNNHYKQPEENALEILNAIKEYLDIE